MVYLDRLKPIGKPNMSGSLKDSMPKVVKKAPPKKPEPPKITGLEQKAVLSSLGASAKSAVLDVFGDVGEDICIGKIQAALQVADDLRIPKKEISFTIDFNDLSKAHQKWKKLQDADEEDWNEDD